MPNRFAKPISVNLTSAQWDALSSEAQRDLINLGPNAKAPADAQASSDQAQRLLRRIQLQKEEIAALQRYWEETFPEFAVPDERQCRVWLNRYEFDIVVEGLDAALVKQKRRESDDDKPWTVDAAVRYASGCMKKLAAKKEAGQ